jgi:hypothetical protein
MTASQSPSFKNWPEEIASVYGQLPMPSLHEFVLANEKFASEMRRHGKDLHKMAHAIVELKEMIQTLEQHLQVEIVDLSDSTMTDSHEDELPLSPASQNNPEGDSDSPGSSAYYPAWEVDMMRQASKIEQRQWEEIYVAMLEVILQTMDDQKELQNQVTGLLSPLKSAKTAATATSHLFFLHEKKVMTIKDQMLAHLKDIDIEPIIPEIGDLYDEDFHRVIESVTPAKGVKLKRNTVARIVRIGYKRHGELVRQADVCVYE